MPEPTVGHGPAPAGPASEADRAAGLESAFRHLLKVYPLRYRTERGDEIIDTLMAHAAPGQRFPHSADVVDIVQAGLVERCRIGRVPGLAGGLVAAAPTALALAAGVAAFLWWRIEGGPAATPTGHADTLGPIAYAAWLLAALARAVLPAPMGRFAIAAAIVTTAVAVPALALTPLGERPPLWVLMALAGFGLVALLGTATGLGAGPPTVEARMSGLAGAIAVAVCTSTLTQAWKTTPAGYYGPTIARVGAVAVGAVAALAVVAAYHLSQGRPAHDRLWAAALLGLPAGWLGPFTGTGAGTASGTGTAVPHFGRLAQVVFATCVAVAVMHLLARRPHGGHERQERKESETARPSLTRAGWHAAGTAAGLASWIALSYLGIAGPRPATDPPPYVYATIAVLVTVALAAGVPRRPAVRPFLTAAAATAIAAWLVAVYVNDWTLYSWHDFGHTAAVATAVALVPLCECAVVAARARRSPQLRRAANAVLLVALGWLAVLTIRYLPGWAPPLLGAAACVAASRIPVRRRTA